MLHAALIFKPPPPRSSDYEARGKLYDVGPVEQFMHNNVFLNNKILFGGGGAIHMDMKVAKITEKFIKSVSGF